LSLYEYDTNQLIFYSSSIWRQESTFYLKYVFMHFVAYRSDYYSPRCVMYIVIMIIMGNTITNSKITLQNLKTSVVIYVDSCYSYTKTKMHLLLLSICKDELTLWTIYVCVENIFSGVAILCSALVCKRYRNVRWISIWVRIKRSWNHHNTKCWAKRICWINFPWKLRKKGVSSKKVTSFDIVSFIS